MRSQLRSWLEGLGDIFWLRPALLVALGLALGQTTVWAERSGATATWISNGWVYAGGEAGARALLGAIASSSIGVAGTVFSITVAALSLASGQMGPRLLRNFNRNPGNQLVLGTFLGTFTYSLVLLRTVRSVEEVAFVPHLGVTLALGLALLCVAALVWFVHHVVNSINVDTVIGAVHGELVEAIAALEPGSDVQEPDAGAVLAQASAPLRFAGSGYLRSLDEEALADWAAARGVRLRLQVRPGDFLLPGGLVGEVVDAASHPRPSADRSANQAVEADAARTPEAAFADAAAVGQQQAASQDLEFAVRQLVEVAVRALSPGINDPFTAMAVVERLGAALCTLAERRLPAPVLRRDGRVVLARHVTDYDGLCDAMFHMIRQNGSGSTAVMIRLVETIRRVEEVEDDPRRQATLRRHRELALAAGRKEGSLSEGEA